MSIGTAFIRTFAALLLSVPLFVGLSFYLGAASADDTLLNANFIADSFERADLYQRVYSDVFLRPEFSDWTDSLTGGFQTSGDEKAQLLKSSVPPDYIEAETERNVSQALEFLKGQDDQLDVFIQLDTPLENARPTAFAFLDRRIDELPAVPVASPEELSEEIAAFLTSIGSGQIPPQVPSDEGLDSRQRTRGYRQGVRLLAEREALSAEALDSLNEQEPAVLAALRDQDLRAGLKLAARSVAEPRIDAGIAGIRQQSGPQDRMDLVDRLAASSDRTPDQVLRDVRIVRFLVSATTSPMAQWTALAIAALCVLAMAALFIPYWKHVIFWPSFTLLVVGSLLLLLAFSTVLDSALVTPAICAGADPQSCRLLLDIGQQMAAGIAAIFAEAALKVIIAGALGVLLSFAMAQLLRRKAS